MRSEAELIPGVVVAEDPAVDETAPTRHEPPAVRFLSIGREARAFRMELAGQEEGLKEVVPSAVQRPASLASHGGHAAAEGGLDRESSSGSVSAHRTTIHGEFFHAMISYRVASEGDGGSGLSNAIYDSITRVSLEKQFRLPPALWGEWPSFAKRPSMGIRKAAKVYLDAACLEEGEPWEAGKNGMGGFAGSLRCSVVFIPLLSFTSEGGGSLGQMMRLATTDYCDNVLLEFTVALGVWRSERLPLRAILPVLIGEKDNRGIYSAFPFAEVSRLPDKPSEKTNARAAEILLRFGLEEEAGKVRGCTVRQVVSAVLSFQGVQLSNEGVHSKAVRAVAESALRVAGKHVLEGMQEFLRKGRRLKHLSVGTPCGYEVLQWLQEEGLGRYAAAFAGQRIDSLLLVSNLERPDVERLVQRTAEGGAGLPAAQGKGAGWGGAAGGDNQEPGTEEAEGAAAAEASSGDVVELMVAVRALKGDKRARRMRDRLLWYLEESVHGYRLALTRSEGIETVMMRPEGLLMYAGLSVIHTAGQVVPRALVWSRRLTVQMHGSDVVHLCVIGVLDFSIWISGPFFSLLGFPPPVAYEYFTRMVSVLGLVSIVAWIAEAIHFRGDDAVPDTFLRHVRYPLLVLTQFLCAFVLRFLRRQANKFPPFADAITCLFFAIGCFLGEDPDSNALAWFYLPMAVGSFLMAPASFSRELVAKRTAVKFVTPERAAYDRAWGSALGAEGGQAASVVLSEACAEISRACNEEWRAFEATVPRFGRHAWWAGTEVVREGPFTRKGKPRQATSDIDVLFQQARVLNPHFQDWVRSWAGWGNGAQYVAGPVKHAGRAIEKCIRSYGRDAAALSDLVRCTVVYPTLQGVADFFAAVRERSDKGGLGMLRIRRVKNRLDAAFADPSGYRDLAILVEVGWLERGPTLEFVPVRDWAGVAASRLICEIQVHVAAVYEVKNVASHDRYKMYRDMTAS